VRYAWKASEGSVVVCTCTVVLLPVFRMKWRFFLSGCSNLRFRKRYGCRFCAHGHQWYHFFKFENHIYEF
jgi:hypothetical protein